MSTPLPPKPRRIRVAHLIQNLNYGGMERVLHDLAQRLPAAGFEMHVVVLEYYGRFAEGLDQCVTLHQIAPMSRLSLIYPGHLVDALRAIAPDVVHSHAGLWLKGARAARLAGVPAVVHTEHGRPDPVPLADRLIDNWASRSTNIVIAVSEALAAVLRDQVVHDSSRVRVLPNGVDTERLRPMAPPSAFRAALGIPENALVIGSVGRLEPIKNYELALRAFARLDTAAFDGAAPWLVLVGDGSEREALEQQAESLGIASRVRFLGWRSDVDQVYGAFDVFTLTSRNEGTSISLLEAMACQVCPVVTDVGGNRAVLGQALDSLLVTPGDERALAAAWARILADAPTRDGLAHLARLRVRQDFSLERMVEAHTAIYRSLVPAGLSPQPSGAT